MELRDFMFTSESVSEGHPDKVADQISDAVLDEIIAQDKKCRVACETLVTTGLVFIAGEITTSSCIDVAEIARRTVKEIGYSDSDSGFDWRTCAVLTSLDRQSPDIALGVNAMDEKEQGAGDQGLMFGYATNETPELMPAPIIFAHKLTRRLAEARKGGILPFLRPDGKSQVTVQYNHRMPVRVDAVVIAAQHSEDVSLKTLREGIREEVIKKVLPEPFIDDRTSIFINTTGRFVIGGPKGDCGLTGRKIIADTYGGQGSHGGGAFSGKDPSKVDKCASYMARYVAKNLVAAGLAQRCEVQLAYTIGLAEPVSVLVNTFGTGKVPHAQLLQLVLENFNLKPASIIAELDLLRPIYRKTSVYGHFGRDDPDFLWERTDKVDLLRAAAGI
jgi:S-adenosylmethionine synthetase